MSAQNKAPGGALAAGLGLLGMSALAGVLVTAMVTPAIAVTGMAATNTIGVFENLPDYLEIENLAEKTELYANEGGNPVKFAEFFDQNREEVPWDAVSQFAKDAAIATEDPRFYEHGGVDVLSAARAVVQNATSGVTASGASTITMQYVKNVLVQQAEKLRVTDPEAGEKAYKEATDTNMSRKLKEMRMAIGVEKKYDKDTILLGYLNIAGFGGTVYGIESASRYYYSVSAKDLSLAQAASLIATVNNPNNLRIDIPENIPANQERRDLLLRNMLEEDKISQQQLDEALATPVTPAITPVQSGCLNSAAPYYCDFVKFTILNDPAFGPDAATRANLLTRGGLQVYTTLNLDLQRVAAKSMSDAVPASVAWGNIGGAAVSVESGTGRVIAMAQNTAYGNAADVPGTTSINFNTDKPYGGSSGFQVGSTYKSFTLLQWLKAGHSINEVVQASKANWSARDFTNSCGGTVTGPYKVTNDTGGTGGNISALEATRRSVNTGFIAMASELDMCDIRQTAIDMGIHQADPERELGMVVSDILGSGGNNVAPLSMASAFAGIASGGNVCTPIAIDRVVLPDGTEMAPPKSTCKQSIDPAVAATATYALQQVVVNGTGTASNPRDGIDIMGKTGTTDRAKDTWFVGSTTKVATAVWVGNVKGDVSLRRYRFPSGTAADARHRIFKPLMSAVNDVYGGDKFPGPSRSLTRSTRIDVPNLVGRTTEQAQDLLEGVGLKYAEGGTRESDIDEGLIAASNPGNGAAVAKGSTVTVYTSSGRTPEVADVTGQDTGSAEEELEEQGYEVNVVEETTENPELVDRAIRTDPAAGTSRDPSDGPVTLYVGSTE
ncbi:transglycosylase domain-containing protein [Planctomonas deserti]|uniref:transglycosylase domain-containing protein n=1 Tax=Planctomonas deserti TaxID=2144185 RepID=UPI000D38AA95|nr:transglycosylase domain-containing protein [Planctomonas deserti]